jgi:hypothetical protein
MYASDEAQNNGLIDAFAALSSGNGAVSQRSIQVGVHTFCFSCLCTIIAKMEALMVKHFSSTFL